MVKYGAGRTRDADVPRESKCRRSIILVTILGGTKRGRRDLIRKSFRPESLFFGLKANALLSKLRSAPYAPSGKSNRQEDQLLLPIIGIDWAAASHTEITDRTRTTVLCFLLLLLPVHARDAVLRAVPDTSAQGSDGKLSWSFVAPLAINLFYLFSVAYPCRRRLFLQRRGTVGTEPSGKRTGVVLARYFVIL